MKEIKFRAWEKNLKEIIPVHSIDFEKKMINTESAWRFFNEIVLMQYTGFEGIYEGDILYGEETGEFGSIYSCWYGLVYWDEKRCGFYVKDDLDEIYRLDDFDYLRIAGNMYKNPELLVIAE